MSDIKIGDTVEVISATGNFLRNDRFVVAEFDWDGDPIDGDGNYASRKFVRLVDSEPDIEALKDAVIEAAIRFRHGSNIPMRWEDFVQAVQAVDELEAATKPEPKHIPVMWAGKDHPDFAGEV